MAWELVGGAWKLSQATSARTRPNGRAERAQDLTLGFLRGRLDQVFEQVTTMREFLL